MQNKDESELIALSIDGDHVAYSVLVDRYKNAIFYHSFAIVHDEDAAEDITQETFIAAYYKLDRYNAEYKLSTWLFKIATNKALDTLKKQRHEIMTDDTLFETAVSQHPGPHQASTHQELYDAMRRLTPRYQAAVSLYYWQGLDYEEISKTLGVPVGSVKGWLHRAKAILRKELS